MTEASPPPPSPEALRRQQVTAAIDAELLQRISFGNPRRHGNFPPGGGAHDGNENVSVWFIGDLVDRIEDALNSEGQKVIGGPMAADFRKLIANPLKEAYPDDWQSQRAVLLDLRDRYRAAFNRFQT